MSLTFAIIKPDAVRAGNIGNIIQRITDSGFAIRALKLLHLTRREAEGFYAVHSERPFFACQSPNNARSRRYAASVFFDSPSSSHRASMKESMLPSDIAQHDSTQAESTRTDSL